MKVEFNPRGNGACPICAASADCRIQKRLAGGVAECPDCADADEGDLELVVYSCPGFKERA